MRPFLVGFLLWCLSFPLPVSAAGPEGGQPFTLGTKYPLRSKLLEEERAYLVSLPMDYEKSSASYPVLYLLDGDVNFAHTTAVVQYLARNNLIPPMIVVGVSNTDRTRDLTPALTEGFRMPATGKLAREVVPTAGSADRFLRFLDEELIPHIEATYRTRPYRILVGHSYGGIFAIHALMNRPQIFQAYLVISPTLFWNDELLTKGAPKSLARLPAPERFLYMTMGGQEGQDMIEPIQRMARTLEKAHPPGLRWRYVLLEKDHHGSTPLRTLYEGLLMLFEGWGTPEWPATLGTAAKIEANYALVSKRLGFEVRPDEDMLNDVGYQMMRAGKLDVALAALRKNVEWFPQSANVHDSLGEALEAKGQLEAARTEYQKAVELDGARPGFQQHLEAVSRKLAPAKE